MPRKVCAFLKWVSVYTLDKFEHTTVHRVDYRGALCVYLAGTGVFMAIWELTTK